MITLCSKVSRQYFLAYLRHQSRKSVYGEVTRDQQDASLRRICRPQDVQETGKHLWS